MIEIEITEEQCRTALDMADYAVKNHKVTDIFKNDAPNSNGLNGQDRSRERRFVGTLGEIIYADYYGFPRPKKSFGAVDGQDNGRDFSSPIESEKSVDVKTMRRKRVDNLKPYYVANLEDRQLSKENSLTDLYFIITIEGDNSNFNPRKAVLCGYISPSELKKKSTFYPAGSKVQNDWGKIIYHQRDTYEIEFKHLYTPWTGK